MPPSLCALDCLDGCAATTVRSTEAHGTRVLVARFEAPDLTLGFTRRDALRVFNLTRKGRARSRYHVEVIGGEPAPVCMHLAPELQPAGFHEIPVHLGLLSRRWLFPHATTPQARLDST